jgi:hypothetical protein
MKTPRAMAIAWAEGDLDMQGIRLSASSETQSSYERRFCSMDPVGSESVCKTAGRSPYLDITYQGMSSDHSYDGAGNDPTPTAPTAADAAADANMASVIASGGSDQPDGAESDGSYSAACITPASVDGEEVSTAATCGGSQKILAVRHYNQPNGWTCAPTSGKMIAAFLGKKRASNGEALSVSALANRMGTAPNVGTSMESWRTAMNGWWGGSNRWARKTNMTNTDYRNVFRNSIAYKSRPFTVGTRESPSGPFFNGHEGKNRPGKSIEHYIVARGYKGTNYSRGYYLDPVAKYWNVGKSFSAMNSEFRSLWVPPEYGAIAWIS